jgi:hypothetical protein
MMGFESPRGSCCNPRARSFRGSGLRLQRRRRRTPPNSGPVLTLRSGDRYGDRFAPRAGFSVPDHPSSEGISAEGIEPPATGRMQKKRTHTARCKSVLSFGGRDGKAHQLRNNSILL